MFPSPRLGEKGIMRAFNIWKITENYIEIIQSGLLQEITFFIVIAEEIDH